MASSTAPVVALIGPPNSGKTTLFNRLTGLRRKVANYPGVTVERQVGRARMASGGEVTVVDLPGVSGFSARSPDERITRNALDGRIEGLERPEAIVLVVDATRLETQLMLVSPVLERRVPTLLVLNMADELEAGGGELDVAVLGEAFGVRAVRTDARAGRGVEAVTSFLGELARQPAADAGNGAAPPPDARPEAAASSPARDGGVPGGRTAPRLAAAEGAGGSRELPLLSALARRRDRVREALAEARYRSAGTPRLTERLDAVFLHRFAGPAVFLVLAVLVFQAIFTWATPVMDGVELAIASSGEWVAARLPAGWFRDLLIDGVWAGVGSVLVFLPQILILFLFIGVLEDSGYMARAAVPAILSARTVADERDRLATIFVAPFMTCSARLPVYALLIAAFIPERALLGPVLGTRAATLLGLYALGLAAAVGTAFLLRRTVLRGERSGFVLELPPYRIPSLRSLGLRLVDRCGIFLRRVGRIILAVTVVLWVLAQFPRLDGVPPEVEDSALGRMGRVVEPAIEPLGFDWRIGVGLVSSLAAREVIVGTLGTIYGIEDGDESSPELREALRRDLDFGSAVGLLVFFVFALQCMSTVGMMRRETAGWKWPIAQFAYMLALAWAGAFAANQLL